MKFNKLALMTLVLAMLVCVFVACGAPAETGDGTDAPETNAPETNAPDTNAPNTDDPGVCSHTDVEVDEKAATCSDRGYRIETCKTCGEVVVETAYPKTACVASGDATCTADSVCTVCGAILEAAKGHTFGEAVVTAATCLADGSKTQTCSACNETVSETIPMVAHNIPDANVTNVVAASCTAEGSKTGTCTLCNQTQTVVLPMAHTVALNDLAALTFVEGKLQASCSACGAQVDATSNVRFALTFDGEDVASELATAAPAGVTMSSAVVATGDQNNDKVLPPRVEKIKDATDGHDSVLHIPHNRQLAMNYSGSLLADAKYYVISFDWRITATGQSNNKIAVFGQINENCPDGVINDGNFANALMVDRFTGDVYGPAKENGNFALLAAIDQWYKIDIVVNNETGEIATYIDGQCFATAQNDKWMVTADGEYAWRFGGIYNVFHKPQYDNFTVSVLN